MHFFHYGFSHLWSFYYSINKMEKKNKKRVISVECRRPLLNHCIQTYISVFVVPEHMCPLLLEEVRESCAKTAIMGHSVTLV
ncbi:hypothetical protein GDO78_011891 [Eleutherodactylus coqui]|uniref:Uncharacterized protein n=1 Tax=Eleutherodactylus coqui TaxID=57060 RepID=A0A8J6F3M5_ELECQ|nr:hypothetical protein GDO78_011891 [Eleutherodactylus coqui]